ncbi:MAG: hypothetical protein JWN04_4591 [Myxococcaceae bacterium]|nr:hypothetical protein [Myxococcaceae bacterium]
MLVRGQMTELDLYGLLAATSVLLTFYFIRNIGAYVRTCIAIVLGVGVAACCSSVAGTVAERAILVAGIALLAFGLLFVRLMFIRSVSLNMLRGIQSGRVAGFGEDIGGRLGDMQRFRLVRTAPEPQEVARAQGEELATLTPFGRLVSAVTSVLYALLRVKA